MKNLEKNKTSVAQWCKYLLKRVKSSLLILSTIVGLMGLLYPFGAQGSKSFDDLLMLLQLLFLMLWIGSQSQILDEKQQELNEKQELVDINRQAIAQQKLRLQRVTLQLQDIELLNLAIVEPFQIAAIQEQMVTTEKEILLLKQESFKISKRSQQVENWLKQREMSSSCKKINLEPSLSSSLLMLLRYRFPSQWNDFEHIFHDLSEIQEWELSKGKSLWIVKTSYYWSFTCTWTMFLWAIAWGTVKQVIFRQSR